MDQINKDSTLFGSKTRRIQSQTYNNSRYEVTKISLAFRFMEPLHLIPTLKPVTSMVDDSDDPTNQIEACYVQCSGDVTTTKLKVANAALNLPKLSINQM